MKLENCCAEDLILIEIEVFSMSNCKNTSQD